MIDRVETLLAAHRPRSSPSGGAVPSAVLVPLFESAGGLGVVLLRRSETVGLHRGQMAFPGGMAGPGDAGDLLRTALREAQEELGIAQEDVRVIGRLSDHSPHAPSDRRIVVTPFVGTIPFPYLFSPDSLEVRSVHTAALRDLLAAAQGEGNPFGLPPPVYPLDGQPVWGLSARILGELAAVLAPILA